MLGQDVDQAGDVNVDGGQGHATYGYGGEGGVVYIASTPGFSAVDGTVAGEGGTGGVMDGNDACIAIDGFIQDDCVWLDILDDLPGSPFGQN